MHLNASQYRFKICVIGAASTGKSTIVHRLLKGEFKENTEATVGVEFHTYKINVEGTQISLDIWDSAGQERYRSVSKGYFRDAIGCVLVFDISNNKTFNDVSFWLNEFRELSNQNAFVLLVGNKTDLQSQREVTSEIAEQFANDKHISYIETSALDGTNINETFERLAHGIYDLLQNGKIEVSRPPTITETDAEKKCC